jgi:hypothetical protein
MSSAIRAYNHGSREALRRCLISRGRSLRGDGSAFFEQERLEVGTRLGDWLSLETVLRPSDTLHPELDQAFAVQVEVDQREAGA